MVDSFQSINIIIKQKLMNFKDPILFYWIVLNDILTKIKTSLEYKYKCRITMEQLKPKIENEIKSEAELIKQFQKQIDNEKSNYQFQSIDLKSDIDKYDKYEQTIKKIKDQYSKEKITIINPTRDRKQIKSILQKYKLSSLLYQYENYYCLQSYIYIIAEHHLINQIINIFSSNEEQNGLKEEEIIELTDKLDPKIEDLEIISKLAEFDGVQLWNCTYKSIPHTYMKCNKDISWIQGINKPLLHNSHPKTIENLPLLPPLELLKPSKHHIPTLINFLDTLHKKYPNHHPSINSIFEYNDRLYIFTKETWKINKGWLCYRVAYGDISYQGYLRWLKYNPKDIVNKYHESLQKSYYEKQII